MIKVEKLTKAYRTDEIETQALDQVSLDISSGEIVAITGPSGCGKSTLLNILGLLDHADGGSYWLLDHQITQCSPKQRTALRRAYIGFVFQNFNLIEDLNVAENVEVALIYRGVSSTERKRRIAEALERVGMGHRAQHLPKQLSGGQQQRVAVARALVSQPRLILADEPTGNLDTANGDAVLDLLKAVAAAGTAVVMVTHSPAHAAAAHRSIQLLDGRITSETRIVP